MRTWPCSKSFAIRERLSESSSGTEAANALSSRDAGTSGNAMVTSMTSDMDQDPDTGLGEEPANLKFLRRLVTVLTAVMILGLIVLIGLIVIQLQTPPVTLPDQITLPEGTKATGFSQGRGWFAVTTDDDRILIFDAQSRDLLQTITITLPDS